MFKIVLQKQVEIILMRQLASYLTLPVFVVDPEGNLLYYNPPAEPLLGRQFDEAGEMSMKEWSTIFAPVDERGAPLPPDALPLAIALQKRQPAYRRIRITGLDGVPHELEVVAFPLEGQGRRFLGAVAIFCSVNAR